MADKQHLNGIASVSGPVSTVFTNSNGVYQDGVVAVAYDSGGALWAIVGHENLGGISVWSGPSLSELVMLYRPEFTFRTGVAGDAYNGSRYPDGPRSRGLLWPCGLLIDPAGTFHLFVHNETGFGAGETNYNANAGGVEGEPDFRHIGKLTSSDQGRTWDFHGWIITSSFPSWTTRYQPDGLHGGQDGNSVSLGAGDFSIFPNMRDGYLYVFYTQMFYRLSDKSITDTICVARSPLSSQGVPGAWKKLHNGEFIPNGNCGQETPIVTGGNIPYVTYNEHLGRYLMTSYNRRAWVSGRGAVQFSQSDDLVSWSEPELAAPDMPELSLPYFTQVPLDTGLHTTAREFLLLGESNGTDVTLFRLALR